MMLTLAPINTNLWILRIKGKDETKKFLSNLGLVEGTTIHIISEMNGNLIVNVKDTIVAIGKDLSKRIIVSDKKEERVV